MTGAVVITLIAVLPLLLLWAAYVTTALTSETDTRDRTPGRMAVVVLKPEPIALQLMRLERAA